MNPMERAERYDPEDLERLMLEHSFDELLDEERAYALRHLENRAEYERMRALLHHVREEGRDHAPMDAGPEVRERVLAAFRVQQRPQWRIWLNCVGAFLLPSRPAQYWRPALALGTVAVLVLATLLTWNTIGPKESKVLAEVKQGLPAEPAPAKPSPPEEQAPPTPAAKLNDQVGPAHAADLTTDRDKQREVTDAAASAGAAARSERPDLAEKAAPEAVLSATVAETVTSGYAQHAEEEMAVAADVQMPGQQTTKTTVQAAPPVRNADMANLAVTRDVAGAEGSQGQASQPHTEDELLGLLRAAW